MSWIRSQLHSMAEALSAPDSGCGCLMIIFLVMLVAGVVLTLVWQ